MLPPDLTPSVLQMLVHIAHVPISLEMSTVSPSSLFSIISFAIRMHRALQNPSLLREIFSNFAHCPKQFETDRSSCRTAALTCRAFSGPALDILWQDLESFLPIVFLIPRLKSITGGNDEQHLIWFADEALKPEDLITMEAYARRVKTLALFHSRSNHLKNSQEILSRVEPSTMMQLLNLFSPTRPLFPCIRELRIEAKVVYEGELVVTSAYLALFLSPMLRKVSFHLWDEFDVTSVAAPSVSVFLRDLNKRLDNGPPRIHTICLYLPVSLQEIDSLGMLTCLQELDFGTDVRYFIDIPTFQELATLDNLRKLTLSVKDNTWQPLPQAHSVEGVIPCFASLTHLKLQSSMKIFALILSSVFLPFLEKLDFRCIIEQGNDEWTNKDWDQLFAKLVSSVPTLRVVILDVDYQAVNWDPNGPLDLDLWLGDNSSESSNAETPPLPWSIFASLLSLPIVELEIREPKVEALSNQHIEGIASAWPDLEVLRVNTDGLKGDINHNSLITIATKLPKLHALSISLCLETLPLDCVSKIPLTASILQSIRLTESHKIPASRGGRSAGRLQEPDVYTLYSLAQFLDTLFPCLVDIDIPQLFRFDNAEKGLNWIISGFKKARSRERALNFTRR